MGLVSVLFFNSLGPRSNGAEIYIFFVYKLIERGWDSPLFANKHSCTTRDSAIWLDCLFTICPFPRMKIYPIAEEVLPNTKIPQKLSKEFKNFEIHFQQIEK